MRTYSLRPLTAIVSACLTVLLFSGTINSFGAQGRTQSEALESTFRLRAETIKEQTIITGHGTAFAVDLAEFGHPSSRYMLTACHVVREHDGSICPSLKIEVRSGNLTYWTGCSVLAYDPRLDLALLQADGDLPMCSRFARHEPDAGIPLHVIGSPAGIPLKVFDGYTLEKDGMELSSAYISFFKQGCSGGPVFEAGSHTVVGVAVAGVKKGSGMDPHTCLFVSLDRVRNFVTASMPRPKTIPVQNETKPAADVRRSIPEKSRAPHVAANRLPDAHVPAGFESGEGDVEVGVSVDLPPTPLRRTPAVRSPAAPASAPVRAEVLENTSM